MISRLLLWTSRFLLPVIVFTALWFSVLGHYYISNVTITNNVIEESRRAPRDAVLDELNTFFFMGAVAQLDDVQTLQAAERILQGEFVLPGSGPQTVRLPFDPSDIDQGPETWQLHQASLFVPRVLLKAYRVDHREEFFVTARDVILAWASYERRAFFPKGRLWNDHAVAERVLALADFWALYRNHPLYEASVAADILLFAARCGSFLADPSHFTVSTNHGVMQNLALWHLSLAFPALPESGHYRRVALERFREQMGFYVNEEGVVLEHSATYQLVGLQFLGMAFGYMSLQGIPIPSDWRRKFEKANEFLVLLRRPDGSLPMFGDTAGKTEQHQRVTGAEDHGPDGSLDDRFRCSPQHARSWYPIAGYSIWWDCFQEEPQLPEISQTVVAWSYFPGHGHKHADEGSVLLWANGQTWWTNVGYWPYGTAGRAEAESWIGSNAPHITGESALSARWTKVLAKGETEGLAIIDLERTGPQGYTARRQVIHALRSLWLVIDHTSSGSESATTTVWTTSHDVKMSEGEIPGSYDLTSESTDAVLTKFIIGSDGIRTRRYDGSKAPYVGWQVVGGTPEPASAIVVEQPADDAWAVAVWSLNGGSPEARRLTARPSMDAWAGPEEWTIVLPLESGPLRIAREADRVSVSDEHAQEINRLVLASPARIDTRILAIRGAHQTALAKYPRFSDFMDYRLKATYLCVVALFMQEAIFAFYGGYSGRRYHIMRAISVIAWAALGFWLVAIRASLISGCPS